MFATPISATLLGLPSPATPGGCSRSGGSFDKDRGQLWATLSGSTVLLTPVAIFTGHRGVGNAVCRNFLFPLGWPACGVNSTPRWPTYPSCGLGCATSTAVGRQKGCIWNEVGGRSGATTLAGGKWCTHRALASTVRDQMTRASAHNNCLFTLRSYPIPASNPVALVLRDREHRPTGHGGIVVLAEQTGFLI